MLFTGPVVVLLIFAFPLVNSECRQLVAPTNGYVDKCNTKDLCKLGSKAKFSCYRGYKVSGPSVVKCDAVDNSILKVIVNNAPVHVWNSTEPSCAVDEVHCPPLKALENGVVLGNCSVGAVCDLGVTASFKCNTGYTLNGATAILCQKVSASQSSWSSSAPTCSSPGQSTNPLDSFGTAGTSLQTFLGLLFGG